MSQQSGFHNQLKSFSALTKDPPLSLLLVLIKIPPKRYTPIPFRRDQVRFCDEKYKQITTYYITKDAATSLLMKKIRLFSITFDISEMSVRTKTPAKFVLISRMSRSGP